MPLSRWLSVLLGFIPGETNYSLLGGYPNDTIVPGDSQTFGSQQAAPITGVVHVSLCSGLDTGEAVSTGVWNQTVYWLRGGAGISPLQSASLASVNKVKSQAQSNSNATSSSPALDLNGYTEISNSNISFSPSSGSTLTINVAATITTTSSTK